jgi:hypothetical protein
MPVRQFIIQIICFLSILLIISAFFLTQNLRKKLQNYKTTSDVNYDNLGFKSL